jgi:FMN-dependent oxidoreductase (nitrilotriacetate monooxygenase family)
MPKPMHLGWFFQGSAAQAWGSQFAGQSHKYWQRPELAMDLAKAMERASMDYILLEDAPYVGDFYQGSMEMYLKNAMATPRQDPVVVTTMMLNVTSRLGVCTTLPTYGLHPYPLARMIGTLDQISNGRGGWNMVTGNSLRAAQNYGLDELPEHDLRYEIADEYMAAVYSLWDSFEPDSVVADTESGTFVDYTKVHHADHRGEYFYTRGPLNSGPAPQGHPVIAQAGGSARGRQFAATHADTVVGVGLTPQDMKLYRDDIRKRAEQMGRDPNSVKVLFSIQPVVGATRREAEDRVAARRAQIEAHPELHLALMSKLTNNDFGQFPLDEPLTADSLTTNGSLIGLGEFIEMNKGRTLREAAVLGAMRSFGREGLCGDPDQVAERMGEIMDEVGGDGFLISLEDVNRRTIADITDGLVPALQRRGLARTEYGYEQFRDNLLEF